MFLMQISGRFGKPEEIAGLVEFLAVHPAASYITGQASRNGFLIMMMSFIWRYSNSFELRMGLNSDGAGAPR